MFVPLVLTLEVDEGMCDGLCKAFNPYVFSRHSCLCHRFPQKLFHFRFTCFTVASCYHCLTLILVYMCSPGFVTFFFFVFSSISRIFCSIFVILSLICLYLSSPSSFIFTMVEFIPWSCAPTESVIFCRNFSIFSSFFSSDLVSASMISLRKKIASSLGLVDLPSLTSSNFFFSILF